MITSKQVLKLCEDSAVAQKSLQLLGGRAFINATGAKDIMFSGNILSLKFPKFVKNKSNYLTVTLDRSDSYTLDFGQLRGNDVKRVAVLSGLHGNSLRTVFSEVTGLVLDNF